jgi:hypothetical protein
MPPDFETSKAPAEKQDSESALEGFGKSLINSAIQNPINSLSQIGSEIVGVKLPELHYFNPANPTDETQKFAQQAGTVLGMVVPFMVAHRAVGFGASRMNIEFSGSMLSRGAEQAATGAVMGFALTPSDDGFTGRFKNSVVDAGTFGVMGAASSKLASSFATNAELSLSSRVMRSSLFGIGSGIPGGVANAELSSLIHKGQFASASEVRDDVASFALLGGAFGGIDAFSKNRGITQPADAAEALEKPHDLPARANETLVKLGERSNPSDTLSKPGETLLKPTEMRARFPVYSEQQLAIGRDAVSNELAQVKASGEDGQSVSVLDKFNQSNLTAAQKERVLNALAAVRENHVSTRQADGSIDPDQEKNWIHTQGEFGRNIDSAQRMGLTPEQTEDTLIGSMFSDAVKNKSNFMVHHIDGRDGAVAFLSFLKEQGLSHERLNGIGNMILEHQIGPPGFMRMIYTNGIVADINLSRGKELSDLAQRSAGSLTQQEVATYEQLQRLSNDYESRASRLANFSGNEIDRAALVARQSFGRFVTDEEVAAIDSLGEKIAKPLHQNLIDTKYGGKAVELTDLERSLLQRTGNDDWYVPHESTQWYAASRSLINADSIDNYATPGGFSKLVGMNGPETDIMFRDKTLTESLASPRRSFRFAYDIMTPEGKALADAELAKTDAAIERARERTSDWLRKELNVPADQDLPKIPFWNADLVYPDRGTFETEWWKLHKMSSRTAQQEQRWAELRFTGLTPEQVDQFLFAKEIRNQMVDELRREQRVDGSLPPDYLPVMGRPPLPVGYH